MNQKLKEILCGSKYEPRVDLPEDVWHLLLARNKRTAKFKLIIFSLIGLASFLGLVEMIKTLLSNFTQSGFYEYLSLLFSDRGALIYYWKEFAFSLAESLPIVGITLSLILVFIFFLSLRYAIKQFIKGQLSLSFRT